MDPLFLGVVMLQQFKPYFRKHISDRLTHNEYFLLNSLFVTTMMVGYILYLYCIEVVCIKKFAHNYMKLTPSELVCMIVLGILTIMSGIMMFEMDKNHNTPLLNTIILKAVGTLALLFVGIFIFKESYEIRHYLGIILTLVGVYLCSSKTVSK